MRSNGVIGFIKANILHFSCSTRFIHGYSEGDLSYRREKRFNPSTARSLYRTNCIKKDNQGVTLPVDSSLWTNSRGRMSNWRPCSEPK